MPIGGKLFRSSLFILALGTLTACMPVSQPEEAVQITRQSENGILLRGLVDATLGRPPARFDDVASQHCARYGKVARFVSMSQRTTFAFDLTYECVAKG